MVRPDALPPCPRPELLRERANSYNNVCPLEKTGALFRHPSLPLEPRRHQGQVWDGERRHASVSCLQKQANGDDNDDDVFCCQGAKNSTNHQINAKQKKAAAPGAALVAAPSWAGGRYKK